MSYDMGGEGKIWILPIAGKGTRTQKFGEYKPLIMIEGRSVLEWFLISISNNIEKNDEFVFITTEYFSKKFNVLIEIKKIFKRIDFKNKFHLIESSDVPEGPACTVYLAKDFLLKEKPVCIANSDQYIYFDLDSMKNKNSCCLVSNIDIGQSKSFIKLDDNLKVKRLEEKRNISCIASCGIYFFSNGSLIKKGLEEMFEDESKKVNGEYFVAPAINYILGEDDFEIIPSVARYDLGNEKGISFFKRNMSFLCNR